MQEQRKSVTASSLDLLMLAVNALEDRNTQHDELIRSLRSEVSDLKCAQQEGLQSLTVSLSNLSAECARGFHQIHCKLQLPQQPHSKCNGLNVANGCLQLPSSMSSSEQEHASSVATP